MSDEKNPDTKKIELDKLKRTDMAGILYFNKVSGTSLDIACQKMVDQISDLTLTLFKINPAGCKDMLMQINSQLTEDVLNQGILARAKGRGEAINKYLENLAQIDAIEFADETEKLEENPPASDDDEEDKIGPFQSEENDEK